jgi:SAM-dependent methyltransferase
VLDLGCGDGIFSAMLQARGILTSIEVALDYSINGHAIDTAIGYGFVQGDARALPLRGGAVASVLGNFVLAAVRTDVDRAIREVYRVLTDEGLFVLTVPLLRIDQSNLIPRIFKKLRAFRLMTPYVTSLNKRLEFYSVFDEWEWRKKLEEAHFTVEQVLHYLTPRQALWHNVLGFQLFRVFGLLKALPIRWVKQAAAHIEEMIFRRVFAKERSLTQVHNGDRAGYALIVARKGAVKAS